MHPGGCDGSFVQSGRPSPGLRTALQTKGNALHTTDVNIPVDGTPMPCYLARPEGAGPYPAVIVLQEIFGVNTEMKRITDLVASAGYVGLAINYYYRTHPNLDVPYNDEGRKTGFAAAGALRKDHFMRDLAASYDWLNAQDYVRFNHIATWGFCMGGSLAFFSATMRGLAGAVSFYGGQIARGFPGGEGGSLQDADEVRAPLLLVYGGQDQHIPAADVEKIESVLSAKHKRFEIKTYEAMDHGFFRQSSAQLGSPDVADAWARVQAFLARALA